MGLPALHTARMRALLTAMTAEPTLVGWLAGVALREPGELTDAEIAALADAMAERERAQAGSSEQPRVDEPWS